MVEINVEEYLMARKTPQRNAAGLTEWDRDMIGRAAARIEIPFADLDPVAMRDVADVLKGLAATMDFWSRRTDVTAKDILVFLRNETLGVKRKIAAIKEGRDRLASMPTDEAALSIALKGAAPSPDQSTIRRDQYMKGGQRRFTHGDK